MSSIFCTSKAVFQGNTIVRLGSLASRCSVVTRFAYRTPLSDRVWISKGIRSFTSSHTPSSQVFKTKPSPLEATDLETPVSRTIQINQRDSFAAPPIPLTAFVEPPLLSPLGGFDDPISAVSFSPSYEDLSDEQKQVLHKVREGKSIFFTGSAGTGKSVLLRAIIKDLGGPSDSVVVTGSTGIAAINIGGQTLHSWAGLGLGNKPINQLVNQAKYLKHVRHRWMSVKTLIIDEVSMVSSEWFDVLEEVARRVRNIAKPFGGIQLVVCGDFFQLPPVPERPEDPTMFAFNALKWDQCIKTKVKLTQVFRQKDPKLIDMLNDMRVGQVSPESVALLKSLSREVNYDDGIVPTEIVPLRWMAEDSNQRHLRRLPGEPFEFESIDRTYRDEWQRRIGPARAAELFKQMVAPSTLKLKVGAQVMSLRNQRHEDIVNGSVGRVIRFITPPEAKAEGITIVSRFHRKPKPESKDSPELVPKRKNRRESKRFRQEKEDFESTAWPVVRYENGATAMMGPVEFTSLTPQGHKQVERHQVPLILSWALTVHKSQGQTLNRVKVDLQRTFERGQAYVALSRCTSLEGLQVRNFSRDAVFAHPRVQAWSRDLISFPPVMRSEPGSNRK